MGQGVEVGGGKSLDTLQSINSILRLAKRVLTMLVCLVIETLSYCILYLLSNVTFPGCLNILAI